MTFQFVLLTKWAHLESILSIENIYKCLEFEQINELISGKLNIRSKKLSQVIAFLGIIRMFRRSQ